MVDSLSRPERSEMMRRIRSRNTKPELVVRSCVHRLGYRFRLHDRQLPGSPDLVLRRLRMVIFVHGCFWHRHPGCKDCSTPKTRTEFWSAKFRANCARDAKATSALSRAGWNVVVVWECETEGLSRLSRRLGRLLSKAEQRVSQTRNGSLGRSATRR